MMRCTELKRTLIKTICCHGDHRFFKQNGRISSVYNTQTGLADMAELIGGPGMSGGHAGLASES